MPAYIDEEDKPQEPKPTLLLHDVPYESQVVDVRKEGYDSLATFFSGSKYPGDYYQQMGARDTAASSYQADRPVIYGQLRLIRGFEVILSDKVNHKQNTQDSMGFASNAEGVCYGVIVPQPGDIFVAALGRGRTVMYQVNEPERLSPFAESGYSLSLKALAWMDKDRQRQLNEAVSETFFFDRENFRNGVKALLTTFDVEVFRRLNRAYKRLVALYYRVFFNDRCHTFVLPGQADPIYDPNVTRFMRRMIAPSDYAPMINVAELGIGDDKFSNQLSIYDALLQRDDALMYSVAKQWAPVGVSYYRNSPFMHGVYYSSARWVVAPQDPHWTSNTQNDLPYPGLAVVPAGIAYNDFDSILPALGLDEKEASPEEARWIKRVLVDKYYVFSEAFYEDDGELSVLERIVLDRLRGLTINLRDLADLADYAPKFNNLERFYYIPIILNMIKRAPGVF